jgi:hypothetical protein
MPLPRLLFVCFAVPFFLLLTVVLVPRFSAPAHSDGAIPHVSRSDPVHMTLAFRNTPQDPHLRAYQAPVNRELLQDENPLPDDDGVLQATAVDPSIFPLNIPAPVMAFGGMSLQPDMVTSPPDTSGEIGRDYYVQAVNTRVQIFRRDGVSVLGPVDLGTLWAEIGLPCSRSQGDPNVLYDQFAGRWLITQPLFGSETYLGVCLALSDGEDPAGTYTLYFFPLEEDYIYDYPMFAVWHDAYYMTANRLTRSWAPAGVAFVAFERDAMLAGDSAQALVFPVSNAVKAVVADADGMTLPTTAPVFFAMRSTTAFRAWRAFPNWVVPADSSLLELANIPVAEHDHLCHGCVVQPDTTRLLGSHTNGLAHEASYRDFGSDDAVILTHATSVSGAGTADQVGIRWYEIRGIKNGEYRVHQQSTFAPEDELGRWMPTAMQDKNGNLLLQYTVSSSTIYPGIRYTGRLATDPMSTLPQGEMGLMEGSGSQTGTSRWGDYATIALDPLDDCTFWFANEYVPETDTYSWATAIAAVRFPDCIPSVTPTPAPTFTPTHTATPFPPTEIPVPPTVTVEAPEVPTQTSTASASPTSTPTTSPTMVPSPTLTVSPTPTGTATASPTAVPAPPETTPVERHPLFLPFIRR